MAKLNVRVKWTPSTSPGIVSQRVEASVGVNKIFSQDISGNIIKEIIIPDVNDGVTLTVQHTVTNGVLRSAPATASLVIPGVPLAVAGLTIEPIPTGV